MLQRYYSWGNSPRKVAFPFSYLSFFNHMILKITIFSKFVLFVYFFWSSWGTPILHIGYPMPIFVLFFSLIFFILLYIILFPFVYLIWNLYLPSTLSVMCIFPWHPYISFLFLREFFPPFLSYVSSAPDSLSLIVRPSYPGCLVFFSLKFLYLLLCYPFRAAMDNLHLLSLMYIFLLFIVTFW